MDWDMAYESGDYRKHWNSSHPSPELVGYISSMQSHEAKDFLDIGCGTGEDAIFAANFFMHSVGIDISLKAVALAAAKTGSTGSKAKFIQGDIGALPFESSRFSMVSDRGCMHNLSFEMWASCEKEVYRVLKLGGVFFLRGARKIPSYVTNLTFIEQENVEKYFTSNRWKIAGPFNFTMFSDAEDGFPLSNLFVLNKL